MGFEVIEYCEPTPEAGHPYQETQERVLGVFETEVEAIDQGRFAWRAAQASDTDDVMWWIVRVPGEQLCRWIADRSNDQERILDLTTNHLVPLR